MNPFKPNGISHYYQMDRSISLLRFDGSHVFFIFIHILMEHSVSKQWRPLSDAAGSALFAYVPQKGW